MKETFGQLEVGDKVYDFSYPYLREVTVEQIANKGKKTMTLYLKHEHMDSSCPYHKIPVNAKTHDTAFFSLTLSKEDLKERIDKQEKMIIERHKLDNELLDNLKKSFDELK